MPTYESPGVYIEEVDVGPKPITAASTSVLAIVGRTQSGPGQDPTRVVSFADYTENFGGSVDDSFTAQAVAGFFENGGPAAYVVRADASVGRTWELLDDDLVPVFTVAATSPGRWANDIEVRTTRDRLAGRAKPTLARVKANVAIADDTDTPVTVDSSVGFAFNDIVLLVGSGGAELATVVDVTHDTISVRQNSGGQVDLVDGDAIAARATNGANVVTVASANGILKGDHLYTQQGGFTTERGVVRSVDGDGGRVSITLNDNLAGHIPAAVYGPRTEKFTGSCDPTDLASADNPRARVALGQISFDGPANLRPTTNEIDTGARATMADGHEGTWVGANNRFEFAHVPAAGRITIQAQARAHLYKAEGLALGTDDEPMAVSDLLEPYGWVPVDTEIRLAQAGGANAVVWTRTADGFTEDVPPANGPYVSVEAMLPTDATNGMVVRCALAPVAHDDAAGVWGDRITIAGDVERVAEVENVGDDTYVVKFARNTDLSGAAEESWTLDNILPTTYTPERFGLELWRGDDVVEGFKRLTTAALHPRWAVRDGLVNKESQIVSLAVPPGAPTGLPSTVTQSREGADLPVTAASLRAGVAQLERVTEPAMVIVPDALTLASDLEQQDVIGTMVTHCENFRRIAIVDAPRLPDDQELLDWRLEAVASTHAAVYSPHLKVRASIPGSASKTEVVPPSGHIAGVYARTDRTRGVHKAPANEQVKGVLELDVDYTERRQNLLNPNGINLVRAFRGRGRLVWGARNATDDATWRYVNVRRLFNMVETSVENSTQWVVFEPNTASTWIRVKASVQAFLEQQWRAGAFAGTSTDQAYRVRVGLGETMTQADVDVGLLIVEVAIAPAFPAEFVVFRFSHKQLND